MFESKQHKYHEIFLKINNLTSYIFVTHYLQCPWLKRLWNKSRQTQRTLIALYSVSLMFSLHLHSCAWNKNECLRNCWCVLARQWKVAVANVRLEHKGQHSPPTEDTIKFLSAHMNYIWGARPVWIIQVKVSIKLFSLSYKSHYAVGMLMPLAAKQNFIHLIGYHGFPWD